MSKEEEVPQCACEDCQKAKEAYILSLKAIADVAVKRYEVVKSSLLVGERN